MNTISKFTLSLPSNLYAAYESEAFNRHIPVLDLIRDTLLDHAERQNWDLGEFGFDIHLYRSLTFDVAETAAMIRDAEGWKEDITLLAIKACQHKAAWLRDYKALIGTDDVFVTGNPIKASVNQNFGQYVKVRLKARNKLDASGKRVTRQVSGELIRSYTLLVPQD